MSNRKPVISLGLADVIAVETELSMVDGTNGELVIRGHKVEELAQESSYEEVAALLWGVDGVKLKEELGDAREAAFERLLATELPADPMDAIRAAVGTMEATGDRVADAVAVTGTLPVAVSIWWARHEGLKPTPPDRELGQAADYLRMLGLSCGAAESRALQAYLVTVSDHGMNASTFTARVIASTRSDLVSAVTGAVGALKGPLHGGAPGPVLDMLDAIGQADRAVSWLSDELDAGRRIMGMGHRVYRVRDPRAAVFEAALAELDREGAAGDRLELARAVEDAATHVLARRYPDRDLRANVEFYTAVLLEALGLSRLLFTPTFAIGRVLGWSGHVMEQAREDRLIRPRSRYVGPQAR